MAYRMMFCTSVSETADGPRYVASHALLLDPPETVPKRQLKFRLRSTPYASALQAPLSVSVFLRHDSPDSAFFRPSGLACKMKWNRKLSRSHVASASFP